MENLKLIANELIKVYLTDMGEYVVDGRELWQGVGSKQQFADWIKNRLGECDATENEDYFSFHKNMKRETGATQTKEYIIKLDTAKEMAMLERNEVGKQYRRYFIEIEKRYKEQQQTPITKVDEARLLEARAKQAELMLEIADRVAVDSYKQIVYSKAMETLTGEMCLPLPKIERQTYTATEIGERLGISSNMVGKLANKNNLKIPEYGVQVWDVAKNGKQVPAWRYYETFIEPLRHCMK